MVTPNDVLELLKQIGHDNISLDEQNLVSNGLINSIDIMNLISEIESKYSCMVDVDLIEINSFENCQAIAELINKVIS